MKKILVFILLSTFLVSLTGAAEAGVLLPKKKTSLEKRMKKQNKKKKKKGDTTCPKIDC